MSPRSKKEYLETVYLRYKKASRRQKSLILDEFCSNCGYHRKHAFPKDKILTKREMRQRKNRDSYVYVNPILKAKEYEKMLENEGISQTQLAKKLGISRARWTQILNLLKLPQEKQDYILEYGKEEVLTERKLRKMLAGSK